MSYSYYGEFLIYQPVSVGMELKCKATSK